MNSHTWNYLKKINAECTELYSAVTLHMRVCKITKAITANFSYNNRIFAKWYTSVRMGICHSSICLSLFQSHLGTHFMYCIDFVSQWPSRLPLNPSVCKFRGNWNFHLSFVILCLYLPQGGQLSHSSMHTAVDFGAYCSSSSSSGYDYVCGGNGMADEFRLPQGETVIEDGWGGSLDSHRTVLGIRSLKMALIEFYA